MKLNNFKKRTKETTLKDYEKKFINLLPEGYQQKSKNQTFLVFVALIIILVCVGTSMYYISVGNEITRVSKEKEQIEQQIEILNKAQEQQSILKYLNKWIDFKQTLLKSVEDRYYSMNLLSNKIENHIPESVEFYNVDIVASDEINIDAHCDDQKSIAFMINELKKVDIFSDVKVGSIAKLDFYNSVAMVYEEKYVFNVVIELRGVLNEE